MEKKLSNQATDKQRERERLEEKEGNILVKREKKHSDRGRQTGRQIDRQMDRQTDRQAG